MERTQVKPRCASQRLLRSPRERLGMDRSRCPTEVQGARGRVPSTDGKRRSSPAAIAHAQSKSKISISGSGSDSANAFQPSSSAGNGRQAGASSVLGKASPATGSRRRSQYSDIANRVRGVTAGARPNTVRRPVLSTRDTRTRLTQREFVIASGHHSSITNKSRKCLILGPPREFRSRSVSSGEPLHSETPRPPIQVVHWIRHFPGQSAANALQSPRRRWAADQQ